MQAFSLNAFDPDRLDREQFYRLTRKSHLQWFCSRTTTNATSTTGTETVLTQHPPNLQPPPTPSTPHSPATIPTNPTPPPPSIVRSLPPPPPLPPPLPNLQSASSQSVN